MLRSARSSDPPREPGARQGGRRRSARPAGGASRATAAGPREPKRPRRRGHVPRRVSGTLRSRGPAKVRSLRNHDRRRGERSGHRQWDADAAAAVRHAFLLRYLALSVSRSAAHTDVVDEPSSRGSMWSAPHRGSKAAGEALDGSQDREGSGTGGRDARGARSRPDRSTHPRPSPRAVPSGDRVHCHPPHRVPRADPAAPP